MSTPAQEALWDLLVVQRRFERDPNWRTGAAVMRALAKYQAHQPQPSFDVTRNLTYVPHDQLRPAASGCTK